MSDSALPAYKSAGENHVGQWLTENGYSNISKESLQLNEYALKANGRTEHILVQVRTFLHPHRPFRLSEYEIDLLTRRAVKLKLIAYVAYLTVDNTGNLLGDISWERLS